MIRHRIVVVGAFQTLNAAEARHHFGWDDAECELVLLVPPEGRAADETRRMIDETGWAHVREVGPPNTTFRRWVQKVRNGRGLAGESAALAHLVIGNYQTQLARHASGGLRGGELIVLDDGLDSMRINRYRRARAEGRRGPRLHPQVARHRYEAQRVAARMLGLDLRDPDRATFFTVYDIDPAPGDATVRNRFDWLRSRFAEPEVVEGTLFVGSPLVEVGIVTHDVYMTMLRRLAARTDGPLWYRPHPREDADRVGRLAAVPGIEVLELDTVVEYGLLDAGWVPDEIVANHSTTLDTLRVIHRDRVTVRSIPLPLDLVGRRWRPWIASTYEQLDDRLGEPVERLPLLA